MGGGSSLEGWETFWQLEGRVGCAGPGDWTLQLGLQSSVFGEEYSVSGISNLGIEGILGDEGYTLGWMVVWDIFGGGGFEGGEGIADGEGFGNGGFGGGAFGGGLGGGIG